MTSKDETLAIAGLRPGDHLCVIYGTEEEHRALLTTYLRHGLERNEKVVYIVDARTSETVLGYLRDDGLDVEPYLASGQLSMLSVGDAYMREGVFNPEGMISLLKAETERSEAEGYSALRVTGEMTWALRGFPGSDRLMEYEAKLNAFFPNSRAIGLCQYDMRRFEPAVLLDVLATHPIAAIGTAIYKNFYYVPPEEFLGQDRPTATLRHRLATLQAHKRTEEERGQLLEKERALRAEAEAARRQVTSILESIKDAFFAVDQEWRITYVNKAAEPLLRKPREELLGQGLWDQFPEAVGTTFYNEYHRALSGQTAVRFEEYYPPFDIWFEVHAFPSESGLSVYFQDISARKRAEEDLRKLSRAVEQSPATVLVTDLQGTIEYANPKFTETTGYTLEEAIGQNPRMLKSGEMSPEGYKHLWETITSGGEWRGELHNKRKNGELYWEWASISPIRDGTGKITHFLAVKEDISARKEAEESIKRLNERLQRRAAELTAINKELESFSYSVSHDLRAPLRSIDGFSQALLEDCHEQLDEQGKDYLRRVRAASQRMGQLIDDILKLSRLSRSDMTRQEVDLSAMARQIVSELQRVEPAPQIELIAEPGLVVRGDARLLRIAMENLLSNAWKFSRKGTSPRIEFGAIKRADETAYFVRDNGVGFDMKHSGKLFGAFQRLHATDEFPGTGIGLATVQRIIHRHGGRVWAESAPGQGATFYFTL